jgi:hypothetical protein
VSNEARLFCYRPKKTQQSLKPKRLLFSTTRPVIYSEPPHPLHVVAAGAGAISQILRDTNIYHALHNYGGRMAITRVQPLNIFTASELTHARDFLAKAEVLVTDVKSLFRNSGDFVIAARLKDIQGRLADEIQAVERLIAASKPGLRH